jgi:hypothetical protein
VGTLLGTEPLGNVVRAFDKLIVEDYQRLYVWEEPQIDGLFQDLEETVLSGNDHFFGTLILQTDEDTPGAAAIVDGQQRITTIMLVVAAIRDQIQKLSIHTLPSDGVNFGDDVLGEARKFINFGNSMLNFRFYPNLLLRNVMHGGVLPEGENQGEIPWKKATNLGPATRASLKFRKAIFEIRDRLEKDMANYSDDEAKLRRLNALLSVIANKFRVLKVNTQSLAESMDIFMTLNSRGVDLQASDLARGLILKSATANMNDTQKVAFHKQNLQEWEGIAERVGDHEVFLRHHLTATADQVVRKKEILDEVTKRTVVKGDILATSLKANDFWGKLKDASLLYGEIISPSGDPKEKKYLRMLNALGQMSHRVLLLPVYEKNVPSADLDRILLLTSILSFRWNLQGKNAQDLETFFREIGKAFSDNGDVEKLQNKLLAEIQNVPDLTVKRWASDVDTGGKAKTLLYMIYVALSGDAIVHEYEKWHLEHIGPQAATPEWNMDLFGRLEVDDDEYESLISGAGNLTLLDPPINVKLRNKPFSEKKIKYDATKISLVQDLLAFDKWDSTAIAERTEWLAEMFEVIWPKDGQINEKNVKRFAEWREGD